MSYTIGYRMPMRDRPRARVLLVMDSDGKAGTEASARAMESIAGLPDGSVVEAVFVIAGEDSGSGPGSGSGGKGDVDTKLIAPVPSSEDQVFHEIILVWNRIPMFLRMPDPLEGMAYPSEEGVLSFCGMPSNDALLVSVHSDDPYDESIDEETNGMYGYPWEVDEEISSLPDGSVVECAWEEDGESGIDVCMLYGRMLCYASSTIRTIIGNGEQGD